MIRVPASWLVLVALLMSAGCENKTAPAQAPVAPVVTTSLEVRGEFSTSATRPSHDPEPVFVEIPNATANELNAVAHERITAQWNERAPARSAVVELGGSARGEGLRLKVEYGGAEIVRRVPPADHPAEAITNLDHTVQAAFDDAGIPRK